MRNTTIPTTIIKSKKVQTEIYSLLFKRKDFFFLFPKLLGYFSKVHMWDWNWNLYAHHWKPLTGVPGYISRDPRNQSHLDTASCGLPVQVFLVRQDPPQMPFPNLYTSNPHQDSSSQTPNANYLCFSWHHHLWFNSLVYVSFFHWNVLLEDSKDVTYGDSFLGSIR